MKSKRNRVILQVIMTKERKEQLQQIAKDKQVSMADIVRLALQAYLKVS